ncbi:hypothetical protein AGMMS49573_10420 [Endomicrobiia bacterium]|nr:hypothetical protein AGMMS49573_10420 [Endomicrobiia bacterium]
MIKKIGVMLLLLCYLPLNAKEFDSMRDYYKNQIKQKKSEMQSAEREYKQAKDNYDRAVREYNAAVEDYNDYIR